MCIELINNVNVSINWCMILLSLCFFVLVKYRYIDTYECML